jgi:dTDP-4-dehydrorhamnose reductase
LVTDQKILLLGANGQLGNQLKSSLAALGQVRALTRAEADLSNPVELRRSLLKLFESFKPTVLVNAAAFTAVDKAESESEEAQAVNVESPTVLAELAQTCDAMLVHYSSDYVFDGSGQRAWQEADEKAPLSVYGRSKLDGDLGVAQHCAKHIILRTSWVVGAHGGNFLKTMLRLAGERDSLRVVADQIGAPTSTALLAEVTLKTIDAMKNASSNDPRWGVYHVAAARETSWYGYAQYVIDGAIKRGANLKASGNAIEPITTAEYPLPAPRPLNSRLNTQKIQNTFGITLPNWQVGIDAILDQLFEKNST